MLAGSRLPCRAGCLAFLLRRQGQEGGVRVGHAVCAPHCGHRNPGYPHLDQRGEHQHARKLHKEGLQHQQYDEHNLEAAKA